MDWLRIQEFDDDNPGTVILDRDDPDHGRMTVYNGRKPWSANGVVGIVILPSGISSDRLKDLAPTIFQRRCTSRLAHTLGRQLSMRDAP